MKNQLIHSYYAQLAKNIRSPQQTRNRAPDFTEYDVNLVLPVATQGSKVIDLGSGSGLLVNRISPFFGNVVCVEKYPEFAKFIEKRCNVEIKIGDVLDPFWVQPCQVILCFGLMNFFSADEAYEVYSMAFDALDSGGTLLIKNQFGVSESVTVNGRSEELGVEYFAEYRPVIMEKKMLEVIGYDVRVLNDIYPESFNRWNNTRFSALYAKKR